MWRPFVVGLFLLFYVEKVKEERKWKKRENAGGDDKLRE